MRNKYYTPTLEEFHVGFEYEVFEKAVEPDPNTLYFMPPETEDKWYKFTFPDPFFGYKVDKLFDIGKKLRVKYLDEVDIKDILGFKWDTNIDNTKFYFNNINKNFGVSLRKYEGVPLVHIFTTYHDGHIHDTLFAGRIKNKLEFKKVFEQVYETT